MGYEDARFVVVGAVATGKVTHGCSTRIMAAAYCSTAAWPPQRLAPTAGDGSLSTEVSVAWMETVCVITSTKKGPSILRFTRCLAWSGVAFALALTRPDIISSSFAI